jgi:hypothetical protein
MRDFRDAKAMAHTLRDALKAKSVETTHSECLELIAKAFGYENWNILSAKVEAARSGAAALSAAGTIAPEPNDTLYCSFCRKSQHEVRKLIAGPTVFICDECVELCNDVIENEEILHLFAVVEELGNQSHPAATEQLMSDVPCQETRGALALHLAADQAKACNARRGSAGGGRRPGLARIRLSEEQDSRRPSLPCATP